MDCKVKDIKSMDAKEMKSKFVWKAVMDACDAIMESESKEAYDDSIRLFKIVCTNFPKVLEYVYCNALVGNR